MKGHRASLAGTVLALAWLPAGCAFDGGAEGRADGAPDGAASPDAVAAGPRVVLGTGREAFEALASGASVPLIKGIQGGFHVWTSFLAYGFDTDVMRMELVTRWDGLDESALDVAGNVRVSPTTDAAGAPALVSLGWPAGIFNPVCAHGRQLALDLTVRDTQAGLAASDSIVWVVDVAEEDRSSECAN